jgi:NTP pyrophosphatase (non-canonical NTP hydrolase)
LFRAFEVLLPPLAPQVQERCLVNLQQLQQRALAVRASYATLEERRYGRQWTREELAAGFVGDVGDLMKLVLAQAGVRDIPDAKAKFAHELADCLWSLLVLAYHYDVDLEQSFLGTMTELESHIERELR